MAQWGTSSTGASVVTGGAPGQTGGSGMESSGGQGGTQWEGDKVVSVGGIPVGGATGINQLSPTQRTYTDEQGNVHLQTDPTGKFNVGQGSQMSDAVIGGFFGGYSGSGFRQQGMATLLSPAVQAQVGRDPNIARATAQAIDRGDIQSESVRTGKEYLAVIEANKRAQESRTQYEQETTRLKSEGYYETPLHSKEGGRVWRKDVKEHEDKTPLFQDGKPTIGFTESSPKEDVIYHPKYGLMITKEKAKEKPLSSELQPDIDASDYVFTPLFKKAQGFTLKASEFIESKLGYTPQSNIAKKFVVGATEGVASLPEFGAAAALGGETVIRNIKRPKEVAKALGAGVVLTFGGLAKGFEEKPAETVGMIFAMKKAGDVGIKLLSRSPVKTGKVEVPVTTTEKPVPIWKGVYTDVMSSKPVVGLGKSMETWKGALTYRSRFFTSDPNVLPYSSKASRVTVAEAEVSKPNVIVGMPKPSQVPRLTKTIHGEKVSTIQEGYFPRTGIETAIITNPKIMKKLGYAATETEKVAVGTELIGLTRGQKTAFQATEPRTLNLFGRKINLGTRKTLLYETETLPPEGVKETIKFVKEKRGKVEKVRGSFSAQPQMMPEYRRIPGDIDIHTLGDEVGAVNLAQELQTRLSGKGIESRLKGSTIETRGVKKDWVHAVQFLSKEPAEYGGIGDVRYGFTIDQPSINIGGVKIMRLGEQASRKITGSLEFRGGKLQPPAHRLQKDVVDAYTTGKTLIASKGVKQFGGIRIGKPSGHPRGEYLLSRWQQLYPEVNWAKAAAEPIKTELLGFGGQSKKAAAMGAYGYGAYGFARNTQTTGYGYAQGRKTISDEGYYSTGAKEYKGYGGLRGGNVGGGYSIKTNTEQPYTFFTSSIIKGSPLSTSTIGYKSPARPDYKLPITQKQPQPTYKNIRSKTPTGYKPPIGFKPPYGGGGGVGRTTPRPKTKPYTSEKSIFKKPKKSKTGLIKFSETTKVLLPGQMVKGSVSILKGKAKKGIGSKSILKKSKI